MRQKETAVIPIPCRMEITAVLHFLRRHDKLPFAVCICACEENVGLQREYSLCRGVSNRGAQHPCWHTILLRKVVCVIPLLPADAGKGLAAYSAVRQSVATNAFSRQ